MKKKLLALLLAAALLVGLCACGDTEPEPETQAAEPAAAAEPEQELQPEPEPEPEPDPYLLTVAMSESVDSLDPADSTDAAAFVLQQIFERPVYLKSGSIESNMLTFRRMGGLKWKLTLKPNLTDSEGNTFTAADLMNLLQGSEHIVSMTAGEENEILLELASDDAAAFVDLLGDFIVTGQSAETGFALGFGPYAVESFTPGVSVVLVKNPNWFGDLEEAAEAAAEETGMEASAEPAEPVEAAAEEPAEPVEPTAEEPTEPVSEESNPETESTDAEDAADPGSELSATGIAPAESIVEQLEAEPVAEEPSAAVESTVAEESAAEEEPAAAEEAEEPEEPAEPFHQRADRITILFGVSAEEQAEMLRSGEIDIALDLGTDASFLTDREGLQIQKKSGDETVCLVLNLNTASTSGANTNMRKAIVESIDFDALTENLTLCQGGGGCIPFSTPGYAVTESHTYNPEDAAEKVADGGYGYWKASLWCEQRDLALANQIAEMLTASGLNIIVNTAEGSLRDSLTGGDWSLAIVHTEGGTDAADACRKLLDETDGLSWFGLDTADINQILDLTATVSGYNANNFALLSRWTALSDYLCGLYTPYTLWGMTHYCGAVDYSDYGLFLATANGHY